METTKPLSESMAEWSSNMTEWDLSHSSEELISTQSSVLGAVFPPTLVSRVLLCLFVALACVVGIVSNSLVLLVILLTKSTRSITSCFLINLVSSDLLLCATAFPVILCDLIMEWTQKERQHKPDGVPCYLVGFLVSVFMYNSTTSLAAVSLHRYTNIVQCVQHEYSRVYSFGGLLFCWVYSICWSLGPVMGWGSVTHMESRFLCTVDPASETSYTVVQCIMQFLLPLVTMTICYTKIVTIAYTHTRKVFDITAQEHQRFKQHQQHHNQQQQINYQAYNKDPPFLVVQRVKKLSMFPEYTMVPKKRIVVSKPGQNPGSPKMFCPPTTADYHSTESYGSILGNYSNSQRETRAMVKLLGLICVFVLTWLPLHVNNLMYVTDKGKVNGLWDSIAFLLACANSCLNPVLFGLASDQFRQNARRRLWSNHEHRMKHEQPTADVVQQVPSGCSARHHHELQDNIQNGVSSAEVSLHQHQTAAVIHMNEERKKTISWISHPSQLQVIPNIITYTPEQKTKQASKSTRKKKVPKQLVLPEDIRITSPHLLHKQTPLPPISSI